MNDPSQLLQTSPKTFEDPLCNFPFQDQIELTSFTRLQKSGGDGGNIYSVTKGTEIDLKSTH